MNQNSSSNLEFHARTKIRHQKYCNGRISYHLNWEGTNLDILYFAINIIMANDEKWPIVTDVNPKRFLHNVPVEGVTGLTLVRSSYV